MRTLPFLFLLPLTVMADTIAPILLDGVIEGAPYQLAVPAQRNGHLLIHAHGYRPEGEPLLAELDLEDTAYGSLVADGWMVAISAYRRNEMIIADAMTDLISLRDRVEAEYGPLVMVLLEGQSMGGAIVTHLAESEPTRFDGAVALGAALQITDPREPLSLTHQPLIPLLFVSNRSERKQPEAYVIEAAGAPVVPVFWTINRDGHVNLNEDERMMALDALIEWIESGEIAASRDITVEVTIEESTVHFDLSGATGRVVDITHNYGNVFIDFVPQDFLQIGINPGDDFVLRIGETSVLVRYGTTFSDVPRGDWVAFPTAEGNTIIAINYGNAFDHLKPAVGDAVRIEPAD